MALTFQGTVQGVIKPTSSHRFDNPKRTTI